MDKQNLSKIKKEDHIAGKKNKAISSEKNLADILNQKKGTKTDPTNKKLDGESHLADMSKKNPKGPSMKKISAEKSLQDTPAFRKGNTKKSTKLAPESNLANDMKFPKGTKSVPSNTKLDSEKHLAENKIHIMGFNEYIKEYFAPEEFFDDENTENGPAQFDKHKNLSLDTEGDGENDDNFLDTEDDIIEFDEHDEPIENNIHHHRIRRFGE